MALVKRIRGYFAGWDPETMAIWAGVILADVAFWLVVFGAFLIAIGAI